jgi:hypothetical protein
MPPVLPVSLDDTRLIPVTLRQLWHSTRPALPRDPRNQVMPRAALGSASGRSPGASTFAPARSTTGLPEACLTSNRAPGWCASGFPTATSGSVGSLASMGPQGGDGGSPATR